MRIALLASTLVLLVGLGWFFGLGSTPTRSDVESTSTPVSAREPKPHPRPATPRRWVDPDPEPTPTESSIEAPIERAPAVERTREPLANAGAAVAPLDPDFEWKWNRANALAEAAKLDRAPDELVRNPAFSSMQDFLSKLAEHRNVDPNENLEGAFALFLNADYHLIPDLLVDGWVGLLEYGPGVEVSPSEREQLRPVLLACSEKIREVDARLFETYGGGASPLTAEEAESFMLERRLECGEVYFELMAATRRVLGDERFAQVASSFRNMGLYPE